MKLTVAKQRISPLARLSAMTLTVLVGVAGCATAGSNWPDFTSEMKPGLSSSPVMATLPANVAITTATSGIPPDQARWLGKWSGWACRNQSCDTKLAVEKISAEGVSLVYAFASAQVTPSVSRLSGKFVGDELQATLPNGATLTYRMRKSGEIEFLYRQGANFAAGILTKDS